MGILQAFVLFELIHILGVIADLLFEEGLTFGDCQRARILHLIRVLVQAYIGPRN